MRLREMRLSKHERFTVKVLLELRRRLQKPDATQARAEALKLTQATLDALHAPRDPSVRG
jgi:hypothetical protein